MSEIYAAVLFDICNSHDSEKKTFSNKPIPYGYNSEKPDFLCNMMLVLVLEGSEELHDQEISLHLNKGPNISDEDFEQKVKDIRNAIFACFKFISDMCFY